MRKEARHTQMWDRASGVHPDILEHLPPQKNRCLPITLPVKETETAEWPLEAKLIETMKQGVNLREAQETLTAAGEKKNAVKQAALTLKKLFE